MLNTDTPKRNLLGWVICLGALCVYLLWPTRNYYWDGISFAQAIEDAPAFSSSLVHPNHLIYNAVGYFSYELLHALGFSPRALTVLQIANSALSALAAYFLFAILLECLEVVSKVAILRESSGHGFSRAVKGPEKQGLQPLRERPFLSVSLLRAFLKPVPECAGSVYLASGLTLLFLFSATWWKFSTDANSYVPSLLLLLLCFRWLLPWRQSHPLRVAIVHASSILFHQLAVLFYPVALAGLLLQNRSASARRKAWLALQYSGVAFVLTVGSYLLAFYWQQERWDGTAFFRWVTSHSPEVSFSFDTWSNTVYSLRGHLRLFLGGRMASVLREWSPVTVGLVLVLGILLSALITQVVKHCKDFAVLRTADLRQDSRSRSLIALLAVWVTAYLMFLFFWLPWNTFYRLFYLPALILLAGVVLIQSQSSLVQIRKYRLALLASAVAVFNLTFYILPYSRVEANPPLEFALKMNRVLDHGVTVYYGAFITDNWTIRYFNPGASWKPLNPQNLSDIGKGLPAGDVWLDTTAFDLLSSQPEGREWLSAHSAVGQRYELVNTSHRIIFQKVIPNIGGAPQQPAATDQEGEKP